MLECLNIFGNAGGGATAPKDWSASGGESNSYRRGSSRFGGSGPGGAEIEKKDDGKVTSLQMTYAGEGEPLVLL